jgi:predicted transcriptional regulator of viral defense system
VFSKHEIGKLFPADSPKTLAASLRRHVKDGLIEHACRSVYVNRNANSLDSFTIERIAILLRAGHYNYVSLESALSEYGAISQIPLDRLTILTTGRSAVYETTYGTIEFTHTKRTVEDILKNTIRIEGRPLRVASKQTAWRDLKRVGRNIDLVDLSEVENG